MKHQIYGGTSFPFVTSVSIPVVKWIVWAVLLSPIAILVGIAALIFGLMR
jgi:hypothetical protein